MVRDLNEALGRKPRLRSFMTLRTPERLKMISRARQTMIRRTIVAILLMTVLTVGAVAVFNPQTTAQVVPVRINSGAHGALSDVMPDENEIAAARSRLGDKGFIAYLACTYDNVSQATLARQMGDMAGALGLRFQAYNANNDAYTQLTQIEQARLEGAKAVILCPLDRQALTDAVVSMETTNIPLVFTTLMDNTYGVKEDSNNYDLGLVIGRLAGQFFSEEQDGIAQVVVLSRPGFPAADARNDGMEAGFRDTVPDVNFIGRVEAWNQDNAYQAIKKLIDEGTPFNVILAINDVAAYGAIKAMQDAGFDPNAVIVVSANGEAYAQQLILEGQFLRGTVAVDLEESAQIAIDAVVKMLAGSEVPEFVSYPPGDILTREVLTARGG
jgi:ABC-type sugar transport system substrate-binding protein